ncbi:ATP-binding protein [Luteolibacter arcticus]|uniref:histidine kinase n=1 Tax=Luteolibacter arcticus TaxID=1581411 RepID=A0ABT3GLX5_9BACT|nr:ATP-binding protein [Luteolibacter arcticus]MCW1924471.1 ATP-binding protein [Luteolibacter arcticus]
MSWVTVLWSMIAASCLTLAVVHGLVWWWRRDAWANLLFALTAVATTFFAAGEMWMMHAMTPEQFATAVRWTHVPVWVLVVSLVGFVKLYMNAGRTWLAWTVCSGRTLALILNFLTGVNMNYREITALRQIPFLGEPVSGAVGIPNPWMLVGQVTSLALVVFVADAGLTVWRRGERRKALLVGGSIVCFVLAGQIHSMLVFWGIIQGPILVCVFYMGIVAAMAFELSRDVLRAARISDELRESEQRMSLAVEAANLGLWVWELARDQIWATPRCRAILGFTPEERITFPELLARVTADERVATERGVRMAMERCEPYEGEFRLADRAEGERWITAVGRVECGSAGAAIRMHGVIREITERRRSQQEAARLRQEIAHAGRVSMMGQLASALAHEINQPLGAILRNAEAAELFLKNPSPDLEEIRAILADIRMDDQRAGAVIDRMRGLLKRHALKTQALELSELVGEVVRLTRVDAAARHVKLEVEMPEGLPAVRGDRVHVQQVLLNLILNGMDALNGALPPGRCLTVRAQAREKRMVEIAVSDCGHGIPVDQLPHVFDPFFTTKEKGMGVGLPISRTIIEGHGGELWAENNDGGGATFRFTLPMAVNPAES